MQVNKQYKINNKLLEFNEELNYCIICHPQNKDSCRSGYKDKNNNIIQNNLGNSLSGCPLNQKISEMNLLRKQGYLIGSLAIMMLDNPLALATGYRICNDCMKSCIFQKKEPVDIPKIETIILDDILNLTHGFEIYSLLARWDPLGQITNKLVESRNILIIGNGPAGFSAAYKLKLQGHNIILSDATKLEGIFDDKSLIEDAQNIDYYPMGFGGVMEYGITERWNKRNLYLIRILLERMGIYIIGGVVLGQNITIDDALNFGFDKIILALGAGEPKIIEHLNSLPSGVRFASDFLMSLYLTGAKYKGFSSAIFQLKMPIAIIGGGLTAIDAAVEAKKFYIDLLKSVEENIQYLKHNENFNNFYNKLNEYEQNLLMEYISHIEHMKKGDLSFLEISLFYRSEMKSSPAYKLNHFELQELFDNAINFYENSDLIEVEKDEYGFINYGIFNINNKIKKIKVNTLLIAIGMKESQYIKYANYDNVHIIGDMDKKYQGSVVKAIASAFDLSKNLIFDEEKITTNFFTLIKNFTFEYNSYVVELEKLENNIFKITINSPSSARKARIGDIFKIQIYHNAYSKNIAKQIATEPIALTLVVVRNNNLTFIFTVKGDSTKILSNAKKNDNIFITGPSGKNFLDSFNKANKINLIFSNNFAKIALEIGKNLEVIGYNILYNDHSYMQQVLLYVNYSEIPEFKNKYKFNQKVNKVLVNIHAPMQCMLRSLCGRCIIFKHSPMGGQEFICKNQYHNLNDFISFNLNERLNQNSLLEQIQKFTCNKKKI